MSGEKLDRETDAISERLRMYESTGSQARSNGGGLDNGIDIARKLGGKISDIAGVEKLEGFNFGEFISDIFKRHSTDEVEEYFTVGTPNTIPPISSVYTRWPKPWLFTRSLLASALLYFMFSCALDWFENVNLLPGLMAMGTIAIPFSTLIFFVEVNVRRNVSLYQVMRGVLFGGIMSLIFSLLLFALPMMESLSWLGASVAGIVEETGKLVAVVVVVDMMRYRYKLNGLLFGAAIGTGFAMFESMGYAFRILLSGGLDAMMSNIHLRGVLSPLGHIVWTAIASAALWRVANGKKFKFVYFKDDRFLRLFCVPVALHMLWNSGLELPFMTKYWILGAVAWLIVLALIQEGLKELRKEKENDKVASENDDQNEQ